MDPESLADHPLGWAIAGLGKIASTQIAPAMARSASSTLVSVVSRDRAKAETFAKEHGARRGTDTYQGMLADPEVDAAYIATPNAMHADQVVEAAEAGKHVLCDKPLATSVADAQRAVDACRSSGVRLGITFQTRLSATRTMTSGSTAQTAGSSCAICPAPAATERSPW